MALTKTKTAPEQDKPLRTYTRREELLGNLRTEFGEGRLKEVLSARDNAERKRILVDSYRNKGLNGEAEKVANHTLLNMQELDRKEGWFTWLMRKTKDVVLAPFRAIKWVYQKTFVEHPYLTIAAILALVGGGIAAWYYLSKGAATTAALNAGASMEGARQVAGATGVLEGAHGLEGIGSAATASRAGLSAGGALGAESAGAGAAAVGEIVPY